MTEIFYDNLSLNQNQTKPLTGSFVMEDWRKTKITYTPDVSYRGWGVGTHSFPEVTALTLVYH